MPYKDLTKQREAQRKSYWRNRPDCLSTSRQKKEQLQAFVNATKATEGCSKCGEDNPKELVFADLNKHGGDTRRINDLIGEKQSLRRIKTEIERRTLLCKNCLTITQFATIF